jgi:hypothetical protein
MKIEANIGVKTRCDKKRIAYSYSFKLHTSRHNKKNHAAFYYEN